MGPDYKVQQKSFLTHKAELAPWRELQERRHT